MGYGVILWVKEIWHNRAILQPRTQWILILSADRTAEVLRLAPSSKPCVRAEASLGNLNSRSGASNNRLTHHSKRQRNHNETICGLGNDSLLCSRLSVRVL